RKPQARLRKQLAAPAHVVAQRLKQRREPLGRNAAAAIAHRKPDPLGAVLSLLGAELHGALIGELERVGREIEQDATERDRMAQTLVARGDDEVHAEPL